MMHAILGDGVMPRKELTTTLDDLQNTAAESDDSFWVLLQGKAEPSDTDRALMKWVKDNNVWFEVIGDGTEDEIYEGAQEKYTVKRLTTKLVSLLQTRPEEGEGADVLALFASDDPEAPEDAWLNEVIQAVMDEGFKVRALNDGLVDVTVSTTGAAAPAAEPEEAPVPAKKAAAKKAAAPRPAPAAEEETEEVGEVTRESMSDMTIDQIKEIAAARGITLPPRTRMATYIDAILGESKETGEVEITPTEVEEVESVAERLVTISTETPTTVTAPAMLIVVYNGTVVSRVIDAEEAAVLLGL